jgi:hypothetical protein
MAARPAKPSGPSERRPARLGEQGSEARVGFAERFERGVEIGFGVDKGRHDGIRLRALSCNFAQRLT